jgi:hypothetical protein
MSNAPAPVHRLVGQIFGFWGGMREFGDAPVYAITADGILVAMHISSSQKFGEMDIFGHKDKFDKMFPDGWDYEWIPMEEQKAHIGLKRAIELNKNLPNVEVHRAGEEKQ